MCKLLTDVALDVALKMRETQDPMYIEPSHVYVRHKKKPAERGLKPASTNLKPAER